MLKRTLVERDEQRTEGKNLCVYGGVDSEEVKSSRQGHPTIPSHPPRSGSRHPVPAVRLTLSHSGFKF